MKRRSVIGAGAMAAALAAFAAFFLHPRKGAARREAVRKGGEKLVQRGAGAATLVGRRRGSSATAELRRQVEDALVEALGGEALALRVAVDGKIVTVRGEVGSLDQISRASEVIEGFGDEAEVVNLVRLRASPVPGTATE